jgi:hypothetical protein
MLYHSWGKPNFDETFKCNGNELRISSHLGTGLRQLRQASSSRCLWVDAVCINQLDEPEKGRQVRNMLKIFEKARQVIAWLGDLHLGFTPFRECHSRHKCLYAQSSEEDSSHDSHRMPLSKRRKLMAVDADGGRQIDDMSNLEPQEHLHRRQPLYHEQESIEAFISRSWFSRTWVRQEVFAARDIVLQLGHYQITLDDLLERITSFCKAGDEHPALFLVNRSPQNSDLNPRLLHLVGHLAASQRDLVTRQDEIAEEEENTELATLGTIQFSFATHMLSILQTAAHFDVADSRDRMYGALGMMFHSHFKTRIDKSQWDRRFPAKLEATYPIDYRKSVSEVYQDVVKTAVYDSGTLDVLFVAQDRMNWACDLPSWVLDWRRVIPRMVSRANWRNYTYSEAGNPSTVFEKDILHVLGQGEASWRL